MGNKHSKTSTPAEEIQEGSLCTRCAGLDITDYVKNLKQTEDGSRHVRKALVQSGYSSLKGTAIDHCLETLERHMQSVTTLIWQWPLAELKHNCPACVSIQGLLTRYDEGSPSAVEDQTIELEFRSIFKGKPTKYWYLQLLRKHEKARDIELVALFPLSGTGAPDIVGSSISSKRPNYDLAKQWLNHCRMYHKHSHLDGRVPPLRLCRNDRASIPIGLKMIDCQTRKIVPAPPGEPYVALSYVWGVQHLEKSRANADLLPNNLPKTIEDSLVVTRELNMRYLWIDKYCIDPGNENEEHDTINNMDKIYAGAEITIVAAVGQGPHHGLPRVSGPLPNEHSFKIGEHTFLPLRNPRAAVSSSKWSTRGWTYQEALLSRRRLVFNEDHMYFQCRAMYRMENFEMRDRILDSSEMTGSLRVFPDKGAGERSSELYHRLNEYYNRQFTYHTDTLRAFQGIFNEFSNTPRYGARVGWFGTNLAYVERARHFWGVTFFYPKKWTKHSEHASFAAGLMWRVTGISSRRPFEKKKQWPSWTWAKLEGGKLYHILGAGWGGAPYRNKDEVTVRVKHLSGRRMGVDSYALHNDEYSSFHPEIKLKGWTIPARLDLSRRNDHFLHMGEWKGGVHLDFPGRSYAKVTVLYLGTFWAPSFTEYRQDPSYIKLIKAFLLLEDAENKCFRRIGIVQLNYEGSKRKIEREWGKGNWLPELAPERRVDGENPGWMKGTVKII